MRTCKSAVAVDLAVYGLDWFLSCKRAPLRSYIIDLRPPRFELVRALVTLYASSRSPKRSV